MGKEAGEHAEFIDLTRPELNVDRGHVTRGRDQVGGGAHGRLRKEGTKPKDS